MDRRDAKLLARQLRSIGSPRNDGLTGLTVIAVFFAGLSLGAYLFATQYVPPASHKSLTKFELTAGTQPTLLR